MSAYRWEPGDPLPEGVEKPLRRARHLHKRAMSARVGSNERKKCLAAMGHALSDMFENAAVMNVPLDELPDWPKDPNQLAASDG